MLGFSDVTTTTKGVLGTEYVIFIQFFLRIEIASVT